MIDPLKHALRDVISGKSTVRCGATVQAVAGHLRTSTGAGAETTDRKQVKKQEGEKIRAFAQRAGIWAYEVDLSMYVSEGAEQKVYLRGNDHVLKLNDAIYFETWTDYLHNLLIHNFLFSDTAYELVGFTDIEGTLHAMVQQPFVRSTERTDLCAVCQFMERNGFKNTRNNDYHNPAAGVILEDLHDENVLTQNGCLYFIDTVFYLTKEFFEDR